MRVVDPRPNAPTAVLDMAAWASPAAELLRSLATLANERPRHYDVGTERIRALRSAMSPELRDELEQFTGGDDTRLLKLSILVTWLEPPGGIEELLALLDATPERVWRLELAAATKDWEAAPDPMPRRLAAGDAETEHAVRDAAASTTAPAEVAALLRTDPELAGRRLATLLRRHRDELWPQMEAEAAEPMRRDVLHRRGQIEDGVAPAQIVLEATNGLELDEDPHTRRVLLLPSYWMRPWIAFGSVGDTEVMGTPVADAFLALPSDDPPPALLKLVKALSDEGRLRLLRRMASGPIRLGDAVETIGVTKATAHHHLSTLRQAGLVSLRGAGRDARYGLREDAPEAARESLAAYLAPRR